MSNVATAAPSPSVSQSPPFHGTHHVASSVQSTGCGGSASLVVPPTFNLTTGVGREFGKSAAYGCGPPTFSDTGFTEATTGFDSLPVVAHAPAPKNWSVTFRLNVSWNLSATPINPFGGPFAWASASWVVAAVLYDLTTSSASVSLENTSFALPTNSSTTGNVSGYFAQTAVFSLTNFANLTVIGHHYICQFFVETFEWTYAPSGTSAHASARLNLATGGHQVKLLHWSLS
ncbi:MAG TPA: hypothetical protein VN864_08100 [Thermoplasmata archaeon]|nr:hypothetical protein [Thermoplasmata archaeon]